MCPDPYDREDVRLSHGQNYAFGIRISHRLNGGRSLGCVVTRKGRSPLCGQSIEASNDPATVPHAHRGPAGPAHHHEKVLRMFPRQRTVPDAEAVYAGVIALEGITPGVTGSYEVRMRPADVGNLPR